VVDLRFSRIDLSSEVLFVTSFQVGFFLLSSAVFFQLS